MNHESVIFQFFQAHGFSAEKIEEYDQEKPDFFVYDNDHTYIVELKTKSESDEKAEERKAVLLSGKIYGETEPIDSINRLSGIIRKAQSQLINHMPEEKVFRLAWFLCSGHGSEAKTDQFQATLYGSTSIVDLDVSGMRPCYFFRNSDFYRFRASLDGAIVSTESNAKFLLNPLSLKFDELKISKLVGIFGESVVNPIQEEEEGLAYLAEGEIDRTDKQKVIAYLKNKYGLEKIMDMTLKHMSGTILMPDRN